jgi:hypothetical protein
MAEERPIAEELLDYVVFAPLGLALTVVQDLPTLVDRGRKQVEGQLGVARFVGRMAARQLRNRIDAFLDTPEPPARSTASDDPPEPLTEPVKRPAARSASGLAIEGYDSLAASQVVARLASLDPEELAAIREYEGATRRRQTILNRIAQLESDDG